jgi:GNAT superfamily N-acetyltransferase
MGEPERVSITKAEEDDAEILAEISKRAFDTDIEVGSPAEGGPLGYDTPEAQINIMKYLDCYCILLGESVVGGIYIGSVGEEHRVLERIFVNPDLHRKGIGTKAMELAMDMYPEAKLWTLGTPEWNVRTSSFYEKMGFNQVGWDYGHPSWRGIWSEKVVNPDDPLIMKVIGDLKDGMSNFDVEGEIVEKSVARQVRSKRRRWVTLSVANAGLVDDSGRIVLVLWNEQIQHAKVGDRVRIENGYVNSFRGVTQLNVGRAGRLIVLL